MRLPILIILVILFNNNIEVISIDKLNNSIVDSSNVWYINEYPNYCRGCIKTHKIIIGSDTIIKNKIYKEVFDVSVDSIEGKKATYNLLGFLRETNDKKVLWYWGDSYNKARDHILFDFSLEENDKFNESEVIIVDSVLISKQYKKRIVLVNPCDPKVTWIEGIGDMAALLRHSLCSSKKKGKRVMISGISTFKQTSFYKNDTCIYKE